MAHSSQTALVFIVLCFTLKCFAIIIIAWQQFALTLPVLGLQILPMIPSLPGFHNSKDEQLGQLVSLKWP